MVRSDHGKSRGEERSPLYRQPNGLPGVPGLRIALVYDCIFPESVGGVERRNAELAHALAGRGHQVTLAGWTRAGEEIRDGGRVRVLPLGPPSPLHDAEGKRGLGASLRFAWHCLRLDVRRFDVVETAHIPFLHLLPLALKCALARRPLIVSWYEVWGPYWREYVGGLGWRLFALAEAFSARLGTLATASSRLTLGRLERLARRRGEHRPHLLPCGIDLERVDSVLDRVRGRGAGEAAPPLLYAGRLIPEKRVDLLIEAVARLDPELCPGGPVLRVIGEGPDRGRLEALATDLGVARRVDFAGRLPTGDDVFAALVGAQVAVQPSAREGFGLFPLEAMAAGLPVVYATSSESAVSEVVRDGVDGLAVSPSAEALAAALGRLLGSEAERRRLGASARRRAEEYSWAKVAVLAEELFRGAMAQGSPVR